MVFLWFPIPIFKKLVYDMVCWGGRHCIGPDLRRRIRGRLGQPIDEATTGGGMSRGYEDIYYLPY